MSSEDKQSRVTELEKNYKSFGKILRYLLIIGIIVVSGFVVYFILNPEPGYVSFGILNSDKEAGNYPVSVEVDNNVSFYLTVDNHLSRVFSFRIEILKGNNSVISQPSNPLYTQSLFNTSIIVLENQKGWISNRFDVSFTEPGENQTIITELWEIIDEFPGIFFTNLYLILNVTA
jgi:uncharacterized membrane protein